jgi:hypothetical protein
MQGGAEFIHYFDLRITLAAPDWTNCVIASLRIVTSFVGHYSKQINTS